MTDQSTNRRPRRVLILGANGRFGLAAAQAFDAAGWEVLAQVRRTPVAAMPARARIVALPLDDIDGIVAHAAGADVVVHAINPSDYTRWAAELLPMARQGMDIAERLGARFALPGNVYNYGAAMPPTLNARTPQWPTTDKGRLRVQFEDELRYRAPRLRSVILRAGDFFGTGSGVWFDQVIAKRAAKGRLAYPGTPTLAHAWAYLPDMARAMVGLCELDDLPALRRHPVRRLHAHRQPVAGRDRGRGPLGRSRQRAPVQARRRAVGRDPCAGARGAAVARDRRDALPVGDAARPRRQRARPLAADVPRHPAAGGAARQPRRAGADAGASGGAGLRPGLSQNPTACPSRRESLAAT